MTGPAVQVRWIEVARIGELSLDGRLLEQVHVPETVRLFVKPDDREERHAGMRLAGVCDLRRVGSSVEARLIGGPETVASAALTGTVEHPLVTDEEVELGLYRVSGVIAYVCVGVPHCWQPWAERPAGKVDRG